MPALQKMTFWAVGPLLLVMMLHVVLAALARTFLHLPMLGTIEIASYVYMIAIIFPGIFLACASACHVRVDVVGEMMGPRARKLCDIVATVVYVGFLAVFFFALALTAIEKWQTRETVDAIAFHLSVWPMRGLAALAIGGAAVVALIAEIRAIMQEGQPS